MDGRPRTTIAAGAHYDYAFTVANRGGMYWYHTHAHNLTAKQAYFCLAGVFMVEDEDETALRNTLQLEPGVTELPLLIQDKQFNSAGELTYASNPMPQMMGQLGDTILVNLTPQPQLDIANRLYRFRILNGSNSRIYKLAFIHRGKMLPYAIIGTDAGLLDRPYTSPWRERRRYERRRAVLGDQERHPVYRHARMGPVPKRPRALGRCRVHDDAPENECRGLRRDGSSRSARASAAKMVTRKTKRKWGHVS